MVLHKLDPLKKVCVYKQSINELRDFPFLEVYSMGWLWLPEGWFVIVIMGLEYSLHSLLVL